MESVSGLLCTSRSPSHGSISNPLIGRAGRASHKDYTTSTHAGGYFCCSPCDSYCSTSRTDYIWAFHYNICFRVSQPYTYLSDTHNHTCCSLPADGWDACPSRLADCYTPLDSAAPRTSTSALAWPSRILNAYSSSWGHYTSRAVDSTTLGWAFHSHSYTWGCIISTWGSYYLIIGHLFILLYLHIILVEIYPFFDTLYSGIGCIT